MKSSIDRELVAKIVKLGISKVKAEQIVRNLSAEEKSSALKDAGFLRVIMDIEH